MSRGRGRVQNKIIEILTLLRSHRDGGETLRLLAVGVFRRTDRSAIETTRQALNSLITRGDIVEVIEGRVKFYNLTSPAPKARRRRARTAALLSPRNTIEDPRRVLAKILGMLGSDNEGEVLAAARSAERARTRLDRTWFDLLGVPPPSKTI
jgi:hypothetical protein